jgi:hypothetical protein
MWGYQKQNHGLLSMVHGLLSIVYGRPSAVNRRPPMPDHGPPTMDHVFLESRKLACVVSRAKSGAIKNKIMVYCLWFMVYCPLSMVGRQRSTADRRCPTMDHVF